MSNKPDWQLRQVLVGALRNAEQLESNIAHRFYHIPAKILAESPEEIAYIALYQSKRQFGSSVAGIHLYGRVLTYQVLPRSEIHIPPRPGSKELYYVFQIAEWQPCRPPVRVYGAAPSAYMFTSLFLLQNSRYIPELYIQTPKEYALYRQILAACTQTSHNGQTVRLSAHQGHTVLITGWHIGIYTADGVYIQSHFRAFYQTPATFLKQMQQYL